MNQSELKKFDWHLVWTAMGVVFPIMGAIIIGTWTIKSDIHQVEQRLSDKIEDVDSRLTAVEQRLGDKINVLDRRLTAVETVLILQGTPLKALSHNETPKEE